MALNIDMWLALSPRMRVLFWLISTLLGLLLVWWLVICPQQDVLVRAIAEQAEQSQRRQTQWRKLRALAPPSEHPALPAVRAFSPLDFQAQDRQLIRWQPAQGGGELVLETRWQPVIETFQLLAERGMLIPAFSLIANEDMLHFTLELERDDDS